MSVVETHVRCEYLLNPVPKSFLPVESSVFWLTANNIFFVDTTIQHHWVHEAPQSKLPQVVLRGRGRQGRRQNPVSLLEREAGARGEGGADCHLSGYGDGEETGIRGDCGAPVFREDGAVHLPG